MATLLFQGHASCRITAGDGSVLYLDPFYGDGYDLPADLVVITHQHHDHNALERVLQTPDTVILGPEELLAGGRRLSRQVGPFLVEAVEAGNSNHSPACCMGVVVSVDGAALYHGGDTSSVPGMDALAPRKLDWALLPVDGIYNMGPREAAACARRIGARHAVPIHTGTNATQYAYNEALAREMDCPGLTLLRHGESADLSL